MHIVDQVIKLTKKMTDRAEDEAEDVIIEAEEKAEIIIDSVEKELIELHRKTLRNAINEAVREAERLKVLAEFEIKHKILFKREEYIERVKNNLKERLLSIKHNGDFYKKFMFKYLKMALNMLDEDEIVIYYANSDKEMLNDIKELAKSVDGSKKYIFKPKDFVFGIMISDISFRKVIDFSLDEIVKFYSPKIRIMVEKEIIYD